MQLCIPRSKIPILYVFRAIIMHSMDTKVRKRFFLFPFGFSFSLPLNSLSLHPPFISLFHFMSVHHGTLSAAASSRPYPNPLNVFYTEFVYAHQQSLRTQFIFILPSHPHFAMGCPPPPPKFCFDLFCFGFVK